LEQVTSDFIYGKSSEYERKRRIILEVVEHLIEFLFSY